MTTTQKRVLVTGANGVIGRIVMERLANRYREEAERRLKSAAQMTSWCIYGLVALMIIIAIFKIASIYLGAINQAAG